MYTNITCLTYYILKQTVMHSVLNSKKTFVAIRVFVAKKQVILRLIRQEKIKGKRLKIELSP